MEELDAMAYRHREQASERAEALALAGQALAHVAARRVATDREEEQAQREAQEVEPEHDHEADRGVHGAADVEVSRPRQDGLRAVSIGSTGQRSCTIRNPSPTHSC